MLFSNIKNYMLNYKQSTCYSSQGKHYPFLGKVREKGHSFLLFLVKSHRKLLEGKSRKRFPHITLNPVQTKTFADGHLFKNFADINLADAHYSNISRMQAFFVLFS